MSMKGKKHSIKTKALIRLATPSKPVEQLSIYDESVLASYPSIKQAARMTGINKAGISKCARGLGQQSGFFRWRFKAVK